jgi:RNA polymerase sigma factor (sigma-70 family)
MSQVTSAVFGKDELEDFFRDDGVGTRAARRSARRLAREERIGWSDVDDVEQEIKLRLSVALGRCHPHGGDLARFLGKVARRAALNAWRGRIAGVRGGGHAVRSLDDAAEDDGRPSTLSSTLAEGDDRRRAEPRSASERVDLAGEVGRVIAGLPPRRRQLCEWLKTGTLEEVAARAGIKPGTLHYHIRAIRRAFRAAGVSKFA